MSFTSLGLNGPLNKSHFIERDAERDLEKENFDEAEKKYELAAEMMEKALQEVSETSLAAPLLNQVEKLRKMKVVVDIKRMEAANSHRVGRDIPTKEFEKESINHQQGLYAENLSQILPETNTDHVQKPVDENNHYHVTNQRVNEHDSLPSTWHLVPKELKRLVNGRETDTLLQFLCKPVEELDPDGMLLSSTSKKKPKSQDEVIEQYKTRLTLLQQTAEVLIVALDDKEKENEALKEQIHELKQENEELHQQLDVYDYNQHHHGIHTTEQETDDRSRVPDDMLASTLINQPESFFDNNNIDLQLQDAVRDINLASGNQRSDTSRDSVQYEDLEFASEAMLNDDTFDLGSAHLRTPSLAGLPPLSPVRYKVDANDDIVS